MKSFTRTREHLVYQNKFIELYDDEVATPSGEPGTYTRLRYRGNPPGVVIIPRLPDGRVLLLQLSRYAFNSLSLEFPRGTANPDESAETAAARELHEETGLTATSLETLGVLRPDTAIVETEAHIVLAAVASLDHLVLDHEEEAISHHKLFSTGELTTAIRAGEVRDGFTLGAFAYMLAQPR